MRAAQEASAGRAGLSRTARTLRANNDETLTPREFRPAGAEGSLHSCPCSPTTTRLRRVPPQAEAADRRSWRHPPRSHPNYRTAPGGGRSLPRTSGASWPRPIAPSRPVALAPFCAAKAFTLPPSATGAANATPAPMGALTPARRGPKALEANPLTAKVALLEKNNAHLTRSLARAEAIIAVQKKLADLLGIPMTPDGGVP